VHEESEDPKGVTRRTFVKVKFILLTLVIIYPKLKF